ncbi:MAG: hypothetical protein IPO27_18745 [Bacteroidetes bacterium]|nr:hypothetical protein [Bacteroidota bacterium]
MEIDGTKLSSGDAIGIYDTDNFSIQSLEDAELIFAEAPMQRGIKI